MFDFQLNQGQQIDNYTNLFHALWLSVIVVVGGDVVVVGCNGGGEEGKIEGVKAGYKLDQSPIQIQQKSCAHIGQDISEKEGEQKEETDLITKLNIWGITQQNNNIQ